MINMNGLFMTQSLKKKRKVEEDKTDEHYAFKTSEDMVMQFLQLFPN